MPDRSDIGDGWRFIARGASAEIHDLGDGRVIKLFHDRVSDEMIAREADVAILASGEGVPVAVPLERRLVAGRRAIVYPRIDGRSLLDIIRRRPLAAGASIELCARLQARLHGHAFRGGHDMRRMKDVLQTDIVHGPVPDHVRQVALDRLAQLPDGDCLLHGDFHFGNIMMAKDGPVIIDWSKAVIGDPAADAVRTEMLIRFGDGPGDRLTGLWRDWAARRWRSAYLAASPGVTTDRLDLWRPFLALAWLRARKPVRTAAFDRYLGRALRHADLPQLRRMP